MRKVHLLAAVLVLALPAWGEEPVAGPAPRAELAVTEASGPAVADAENPSQAEDQASEDQARADDAKQAEKSPSDEELTGPRAKDVPTPAAETIESAITRGVDFLLADQNKDGSWGSAQRTKDLNIYAPVPGAHRGFRAAVTAMCISALIESGDTRTPVQSSIDRAETWLLENLPKVRRASADAIYNVWAHGYGISACVRLLARHPNDEAKKKELTDLVLNQYDYLSRYESVDGGWGYYDFRAGAKRPATDSTSFVNAMVLIAFYEAKQAGLPVAPEKVIERARVSLKRQLKPDYSYLYGEYLKMSPMHPVNRPGGSLGRSQACNLALRLWGDKQMTDKVLTVWLDRLFARNLWLDIGRKRPIPHESWFSVAGYFYYYGHFYASMCIQELPAAERPRLQAHLATLLLKLQEKDGSWWDYPLYNYHQQYGTAYAVMSLVRCRAPKP